MKLESVAEYLNEEQVAISGKTLFVNMMPSSAKRGVLLRDPFRGAPIDYELPGYRRCEFQAVVRVPASEYTQGRVLAEQVSTALTIEEMELTGMWVVYIRPRHDPVSYPISNGNMVEFSVNFDACYILTPPASEPTP